MEVIFYIYNEPEWTKSLTRLPEGWGRGVDMFVQDM